MRGLIQEHPLTIGSLLPHAAKQFGHVEVVSPEARLTYAEVARRVRRLASSLLRAGLRAGDMVSTLAWNTHRQFELFHAVTGLGAVLHTANPRLSPEQLAYTIEHAGAELMFVDRDGWAIARDLPLPGIRRTVLMAEPYEELVAAGDPEFAFPMVDEREAAALCYTSGTTGRPKGVLYSHRGCILSALVSVQPNAWDIGARDCILALAPLFHCNGWAVPFMAPMTGAKLVLPGRDLDPARLVRLINAERVTFSGGVPTVGQGILEHLSRTGEGIPSLQRLVLGGSAPSPALVDAFRARGVRVITAWGMTETTHGCSFGVPLPDDPPERVAEIMAGCGRTAYGAELRVVDDAGRPLPEDGRSIGQLQVRGHWVATGYFKGETIADAAGWMPTGDIGTLDGQGFMKLTDRAKDVIKSGGEWISSIELENLAAGHPAVAQVAAIGVADAKWGERPVLAVVRREGEALEPRALLDWLRPKLPKWWLPDRVVFLDRLPLTATGKVRKAALRDLLR